MRNIYLSYKKASEYLINKLKEISLKRRIIYNLIAILFSLFFASAPVALIVNLFLFEEYFNLVALASVIVVLGTVFIYHIIILSIYSKEIEGFKYKSILIFYAICYFIIGIIVYLILIFPIKELIL